VFDPAVPTGAVIGLQTVTPDAPIRPGDSINLIVSKGPDLVEVPDVVGETIPEAKAALEAAGFVVRLNTNVPGPFQAVAEVRSVSPKDEKLLRGAEVTINANY